MPLRDKRVGGIRGNIPPGYVLGRTDLGDGEVQLLSLEDLLAGLGLNGVIGATAAAAAAGAAGSDYLTDGADPPAFISDGAGTLLRTS